MGDFQPQANYPSLHGKKVIVTGGASGIGATLVEAFLAQGACVNFLDKDVKAADQLIERVKNIGSPRFLPLDVTNIDSLKDAMAKASVDADGVDILVNNVANDMRYDPLEISPEEWRQSMAVNLDAAFFATQSVIPTMIERGGGSVVTLGSINALLGPPQMPSYVAAKSALIGLNKSLARQFGDSHLRFNLILPGWVVTERQKALWMSPQAEAEWKKQAALKDLLSPADIAEMALFLASDASRMVTGQYFIVDAGRT